MKNVEFERIAITREPAQRKEADKKTTDANKKPKRNWYGDKRRKQGNSQQGNKQVSRKQQAR
ncbi:hypothetical protein [Clostridium botulinum]|uniref:hypothetical protein n=1 Tax=Clostridium botulinum TaxID=1491 RepID=UPI0006A6FE04|nr:hypothetical protein [Clostridium botulinum]KAI3345908.1 hypothetical protein CIT18_15300 [Clostridium botulinum]KOM89219.1 hypothetical protein ACP51_02885 [Clostridium botulinum]KOR64196.1 hypothetical protein ADT22_01470 [Clostridium botulinum]